MHADYATCVCPAQVRKLVIDMVLSTDMSFHFALLEKFAVELARVPQITAWTDRNLALQARGLCAYDNDATKVPAPLKCCWRAVYSGSRHPRPTVGLFSSQPACAPPPGWSI
jgi:hypothetical protein